MTSSIAHEVPRPRSVRTLNVWPRGVVWLLFGALALRFVFLWINVFAGTSLPVLGNVGLTVLFAAFAVLHAASLLGWRRAMAFLMICAVVTWAFEEVGTLTGSVYGAYHYGDQLGAKLGQVPIIIPFAWFMMIYASWTVAQLLLQGPGDPTRWGSIAKRIVIAALAMTAWDAVMDPGMSRSGVWTWEHGGAYFGVPSQNYVGWLATTLTVYAITELTFRLIPGPKSWVGSGYAALPAFIYGLIALDRLILPDLPELRIVAAFGIAFIALLALLRIGDTSFDVRS